MFWARFGLILARAARVKMSSEKAENIYAQENKFYYYYNHFGGHLEEKK